MIYFIYIISHIKKFLKIKLETSALKTGPECKYESGEHFKQIVTERLNIELGKIEFNPRKRAIAKACLVSLWGKFGHATT